MVHNLICGSFTSVGEGCDWITEGVLRQRYTPYHIPHRTEVMGFMTILHGDDRFYNNIFLQKWPSEDVVIRSDSEEKYFSENRTVGTNVFDDYVTYDEWIKWFELDNETPDMQKLSVYHFRALPVWSEGNAYIAGAKAWNKEKNFLSVPEADGVYADVEEVDGKFIFKTNVYDYVMGFASKLINTDTLGKAFEPEQRFENPDGTDIVFDADFGGAKRGASVLPGPFAEPVSSIKLF